MVINQIHSIGDILFCEPIFKHYWSKTGNKPIVPVRDHLMWLGEYIDSAQFVKMSHFDLDYDSIDTTNDDYLPLRFANQIVRGINKDDFTDCENTMPDKYRLAGVPLQMWYGLNIKFNSDKADELMRVLGINENDKYILVNNYSQAGVIDIKPINSNNYKIIYMHNVDGFTVLDWYKIMMLAQENHHVSTCTFYMFQSLYNKYDIHNIYIYPRPNNDGLRGISMLHPSFKYNAVKQ